MLGADCATVNKFAKTDWFSERLAGGLYRLPLGRHYVVWTAKKRDIPTLVHECLHATNRILEDVGAQPDFLNDEAQARLLEFLLEQSGVRL